MKTAQVFRLDTARRERATQAGQTEGDSAERIRPGPAGSQAKRRVRERVSVQRAAKFEPARRGIASDSRRNCLAIPDSPAFFRLAAIANYKAFVI